MSKCKSIKISISLRVANLLIIYDNKTEKCMVAQYQSVVEAFLWSIMYFCPDLDYLIRVFSQFCSNHKLIYVELIKHVLCYISGIFYLSLIFNRKVDILDHAIRYIVSNFTRSKSNLKLIRDFIFMLVRVTISSLSKF